MPENNAMEKPVNDAPAKNQIAMIVASVVPEVINVRTIILLMARLIMLSMFCTLL